MGVRHRHNHHHPYIKIALNRQRVSIPPCSNTRIKHAGGSATCLAGRHLHPAMLHVLPPCLKHRRPAAPKSSSIFTLGWLQMVA